MTIAHDLRALLAIFVAEWRGGWRGGWFAALVLMPMVLLAIFGLQGGELVGGLPIGSMLMASFACFGAINLTIFAIGVAVAEQRGTGWLRRLRVSAMPLWAFLGGKVLLGVVATTTVLAGNVALTSATGARVGAWPMLRLWMVLVVGAILLAPLGFALAFWVRPRSAAVVGNLVFLPLSYASGFLTPIDDLPAPIRAMAPWLPTSHLGSLAWQSLATPAQLRDFGVGHIGRPWVDLAVLLGWAAVAGLVAALGWRRDLDRDRITG